jgi:ribosomal protein S18 acetylase RimI-like enzyme
MKSSHASQGNGSKEPGSSITILPMQLKDVEDVVRVHLASFPGFFLSFLGPRFLSLLYAEIVKEPGSITYVALDGSKVIGFAAGVTQQAGFYSRLARKRMFAFAFAALGAIFRNLKIIPRLFRALTYPHDSQEAATPALLMSIGVLPGSEHAGIGRKLMEAYLVEARQKGIDKLSLTTDKYGNDRVNRFYEKLGFTVYRAYQTHEGRWINEYVIDLSA